GRGVVVPGAEASVREAVRVRAGGRSDDVLGVEVRGLAGVAKVAGGSCRLGRQLGLGGIGRRGTGVVEPGAAQQGGARVADVGTAAATVRGAAGHALAVLGQDGAQLSALPYRP